MANPYYNGPVSDHYNGEEFFNPGHPQVNLGNSNSGLKNFLAILRWRLTVGKERAQWPTKVQIPSPTIPQAKVQGGALTVTALGHACFLIQTEGLNILTDPVFSKRASPFSFMGPKRVTNVPFSLDKLPRLDAILVSHNHYDHMSLPTLKQLHKRDKPRIIVPLGNNTLLTSKNIPSEAYDWGQQVQLSPALTIHLHAVQHWSARWLNDRRKALWAGFTLTTPHGNILFGGDSGYGGGWWSKPLGKKFGPYRLALLPIGAYNPASIMQYSHMNPEEALLAAKDMKAKNILGIHWGTFQLTNESRDEPAQRLAAALASTTYTPQTARTLEPGQAWNIVK